MQVAERAIAYRKYEIVGRHIIDTWILAQHYDVTARELEGLRLEGDRAAFWFGGRRSDVHPAGEGLALFR